MDPRIHHYPYWDGCTSEESSEGTSTWSQTPSESQPSRFERGRNSRTNLGDRGRGPRDPPRYYHHMPFGEIPPPLLRNDMKAHISRFLPLTPEVMQVRLLSKWKQLNVKTYDGSYDPKVHIKSYLTQVNLFSDYLRVHCRLFPTTLEGIALEWYYSFPQIQWILSRRCVQGLPLGLQTASPWWPPQRLYNILCKEIPSPCSSTWLSSIRPRSVF